MALFPWSDILSVGDERLDSQHKKWIDMFNSLAEQMKHGTGNDTVLIYIQKMIDYTKLHFKDEEDVMHKVNYPELVKHKAQHDYLTKQLKQLSDKARNENYLLSVDVMRTLRDWLFRHITETDKKYSSYLKK